MQVLTTTLTPRPRRPLRPLRRFYMSSCLDLLDEGAACTIGLDHRPLGLSSVAIDSEQAC